MVYLVTNRSLNGQSTVNRLKVIVPTSSLLVLLDFDQEFIILSDASDDNNGYVLIQEHYGLEVAIYYGGHALTKEITVLNWGLNWEQDLLDVIEALYECMNLIHSKFTQVTVHGSLVLLFMKCEPKRKLGRRVLFLQQNEVLHRNG